MLGEKYRIVSELGAGGFGRVYAAENQNLGTRVAIKIVHPGVNPRRLLREAQLASCLRSPYALRIFDADRLPEGTPYIVMELLEGETLRDYLRRERRVTLAKALEWTLQIGLVLREAHAAGLVHRDVKPSNVFVVSGPSVEPHVKLVDFGIAKNVESAAQDTVTDSGVVVGSPLYMAPERVRANEGGPSADQWSVGVVLYEMLSGELPFTGDSASAVFAAIAADPPRPLHEVAPDVPAEVVSLVMRCLRKRPEDRFPSVDELLDAIRSSLGARAAVATRAAVTTSEPHTEETYTVTQSPRRRAARWPIALLGLLLVGGLVWLSRRDASPPRYEVGPSSGVRSTAHAEEQGAGQRAAPPARQATPAETALPRALTTTGSANMPAASGTRSKKRAPERSPAPHTAATAEEPRDAPLPAGSAKPGFFSEPDF